MDDLNQKKRVYLSIQEMNTIISCIPEGTLSRYLSKQLIMAGFIPPRKGVPEGEISPSSSPEEFDPAKFADLLGSVPEDF